MNTVQTEIRLGNVQLDEMYSLYLIECASLSLCIIRTCCCIMTGMYQCRDIACMEISSWGPEVSENSYRDTSFHDLPSPHYIISGGHITPPHLFMTFHHPTIRRSRKVRINKQTNRLDRNVLHARDLQTSMLLFWPDFFWA